MLDIGIVGTCLDISKDGKKGNLWRILFFGKSCLSSTYSVFCQKAVCL